MHLCDYVTLGRVLSMVFSVLAAIEGLLCPRRHHTTLVSVRGDAHTISALMEVICAVILLIRAAGLFFKPRVNPPMWPHIRAFGSERG